MYRKYTKELLELVVKESTSVSDVIRKLNKCRSGGTHKIISDRIKEYGIDTSHFANTSTIYNLKNKLLPSEVLVKNRRPKHKQLKNALIEIGRSYVCEICGQKPIWNDKKLVLQIDHIDGNTYNQEEDNLRFLCPNCHTQTKNWGYNKTVKKKEKEEKYYGLCPICKIGKLKSKQRKYCSSECSSLSQRKGHRPSKEEMQKMLKEKLTYVNIGKMFGVSDTSIRKWAKQYELI
jgi:hypothetical protein